MGIEAKSTRNTPARHVVVRGVKLKFIAWQMIDTAALDFVRLVEAATPWRSQTIQRLKWLRTGSPTGGKAILGLYNL